MASDFGVQIRLELKTAQGETALKRFEAAMEAAMNKLRRPQDIAILKQLAAEVESGKKKLDEIPAQWRKDVETINQISRGAKLLDGVGIGQSHAQIAQAIAQVRQDFAALKQSGVLSQTELAQAAARARQKIKELGESMNGARSIGENIVTTFSRLQGLFAAIGTATAGAGLFRVADDMALLRSRLALVEGGAQRAKDRLGQLFAIANNAQADVVSIGEAYAKFARTLTGIGRSGDDALKLTEALTLALRISGASAEDTSRVMLQLGQALARGKLSGDEFTSVAENGGMVLEYLAQALGVSRGKLNEMAQAGELTTEKILKLIDALDRIRKDAETLPQTVGGAAQNLSNAFKKWVSDADSVGAAGKALVGTFNLIAENFNAIVNGVFLVAIGLLVSRFGALATAARTAFAALGIVAGLHPVGRVIMGIATAATLAWEPLKKLWESLTGSEPSNMARAVETLNAGLKQVAGAAQRAGEAIKQSLDAEIKKAAETVKSLTDSYKNVAADIKAVWDARVSDIERNYERQKAAAQNAARSEAEAIRESTQALLSAEREKLSAVDSGARQMESAWRATYSQAVQLARAAGQDVQAIERQAIEARISLYSQLESAYRSTIDKLIAEEQRHLQAAKAADEARLNLRLSVEDRIRELSRKGMDEYAAYQDRLRQIDEKQQAARAALAAGNFEQAKKLAEEAMQLAERTASAVTRQVEQNGKTVTQTVVSESQAASKAIEEIKEAAGIADAALKGLGDAHRTAAQDASNGAEEAKRALQSISAEVEKLRADLLKADKIKLELDIEAAKEGANKIKALLETEKLVAKLDADTKAAQEALDKLKEDAGNLELTATVRAKTDQVQQDIEALERMAHEAKIDLGVSFDGPRQQLAAFTQEAQKALSTPTQATHTPVPDMTRYREAVAELVQPTSSVHTVYVRKVETNALGGLVGEAVARFAAGGMAFRRIFPGPVRGPGTETSDSIPAMLSNGEYVIRASSVRKYGRALLDAINLGLMPALPRFAFGGPIQVPTHATAAASGGSVGEMVLRIEDGVDTVRVRTVRDDAMRLAKMLKRAGVKL